MARFFQGFHNEYSGWKPDGHHGKHDPAVGPIGVEFEAFKPNSKYAPDPRVDISKTVFPQISPMNAPPLQPIEPVLKGLIEGLWKRAQPAAGATRGAVQIGGRGGVATPQRHAYVPDVLGANTIDDWSYIDTLTRTHAITFRGDGRGPQEILVGNGKSGGFNPPNSRTDDGYLYGTVFEYFKKYMQARFQVQVTMGEFVSAVAGSAPSPAAKRVLLDYTLWRAVMESESRHVGRMVKDECLKAYISTSRSPYVARFFALGRFSRAEGWVYVTSVQNGFVIPAGGTKWGTMEQEIARFGSIQPVDVLGFRKVVKTTETFVGPIYMRRSFRKGDPDAARKAYDLLSGWVP